MLQPQTPESAKTDQAHAVLRHRDDIDGMRAIAVLAVIAFHIHFGGTPGGFVGVDVFFVISGYLITAIIYKDLALSRFSLGSFYERRVRRILPALVAVLLACCALSYVYLLPADFNDFGRALATTALSSSNLYFFTQAGYFASSGPLLHTWSLAVEEQFYIVFPLLLAFAFRYGRRGVLGIIGALAAVSLAVSVFCQYRHPVANFYMPYTRAWELLAGSLLTLGRFPCLRRRVAREACALLGLALVLFAVVRYTDATPFPGLTAIPPCLGAVLILYAGEGGATLVGQALSLRPMRFVGAISYSLYLWHWPLLIFGESGFLHVNSVSHRANVALYLAVCLALATLSWRFVEGPFRGRRLNLLRSTLFARAGATLLVFVAIGVGILISHGLPFRYPPAALRVADQADQQAARNRDFRVGQCFVTGGHDFAEFAQGTCLKQDPGRHNVLLLGDSHAAALWKALATELPQTNVMQATSSNCKPFPGQGTRDVCAQMMNFVFNKYLPAHPVDALLITARWKTHDLADIASLAQWCQEHKVSLFVLGPAEEYDAKLPVLLAYAIRNGDPGLPFRHRLTNLEALDRTMEGDAQQVWHVPYLSVLQSVCTPHACDDYADAAHTVPMLFDHDHYSPEGAAVVVSRLLQQGGFSFLQRGPER